VPPVGKSSNAGFGTRGCYDDTADTELNNELNNDNTNDNDINIDIDIIGGEDDGSGEEPKKVDLCHNGEDISVSVNALETHYGHGDTLGPCPQPVVESKPEPEPEPEPLVEPLIELDPVPETDPVPEPATEPG